MLFCGFESKKHQHARQLLRTVAAIKRQKRLDTRNDNIVHPVGAVLPGADVVPTAMAAHPVGAALPGADVVPTAMAVAVFVATAIAAEAAVHATAAAAAAADAGVNAAAAKIAGDACVAACRRLESESCLVDEDSICECAAAHCCGCGTTKSRTTGLCRHMWCHGHRS